MGKAPLSRVMVAPEYFFAKPLPDDSNADRYINSEADKQLTEQEKNHIVSRLKGMSAKHPDVLLVPGTIAFKKNVVREETYEQYAERKGGGLTGVEKLELANNFFDKEPRINKAIEKHERAVNNGAYNFVTMVSEEKELLSHDTTHLVKNTSYALLDGDIVHRHNKVAGYKEITTQGDHERRAFIPGDINQGNLDFNGISHSFEICADHAYNLVSQTEDQAGQVHIVQSAHVMNKITPQIKGYADYMVHSSNVAEALGKTVNGTIDMSTDTFLNPVRPSVTHQDSGKEPPAASFVQVYMLGETL